MIIDKNAITEAMLTDMELMIRCSNLEVFKFCDKMNWDITYFMEIIDE